MMPVYMIQGESRFGPVKIGYSGDPEFRLGQIQISHWEELNIIRMFEGAEPEEKMLHLRFSDLYIRGEWHTFSRTMLGDVGLVEIILPIAAPPVLIEVPSLPVRDVGPSASELGLKLTALRKLRGLSQSSLACEVGVSRAAIGMIEIGKDFPGRALLWRLDRAFEGGLVGLNQPPAQETAA